MKNIEKYIYDEQITTIFWHFKTIFKLRKEFWDIDKFLIKDWMSEDYIALVIKW